VFTSLQALFNEHALEPLKSKTGTKFYCSQSYDPMWEQHWCYFAFIVYISTVTSATGGIFGALKCPQAVTLPLMRLLHNFSTRKDPVNRPRFLPTKNNFCQEGTCTNSKRYPISLRWTIAAVAAASTILFLISMDRFVLL
jgi:hypothetical protein